MLLSREGANAIQSCYRLQAVTLHMCELLTVELILSTAVML